MGQRLLQITAFDTGPNGHIPHHGTRYGARWKVALGSAALPSIRFARYSDDGLYLALLESRQRMECDGAFPSRPVAPPQ
jgi:hypothetical protein